MPFIGTLAGMRLKDLQCVGFSGDRQKYVVTFRHRVMKGCGENANFQVSLEGDHKGIMVVACTDKFLLIFFLQIRTGLCIIWIGTCSISSIRLYSTPIFMVS